MRGCDIYHRYSEQIYNASENKIFEEKALPVQTNKRVSNADINRYQQQQHVIKPTSGKSQLFTDDDDITSKTSFNQVKTY